MTDEGARATSPPPQPSFHRRFWATTGLATLLAALITVAGALIVAVLDGDEAPPPATTNPGMPTTSASRSTTPTRDTQEPKPDGYFLAYDKTRLTLPHPGSTCLDNIVTFEGDRPTVQTGQNSAVGEVTSYDLVYTNCGTEGQMWLTVPEGDHDFAQVEGEPDAAECAEAANLRQAAPRRMLAQSIKAGRTFCMTTMNDNIVRFAIVSVTSRYDIVLEATSWATS